MTEETEGQATETEESSGKEAIYEKIRDVVKEKTGKSIGKTGGREIFDLVIEQLFAAATEAGTIRLNGGFGSFHIREYGAGKRNLPSGQEVEFGERKKLRYEEGVVTKALVANGGDLEEALKVRGSRAKPEAEGEAKAEKPKKTEKPAKEPAAAKTEAGAKDDDLDLD